MNEIKETKLTAKKKRLFDPKLALLLLGLLILWFVFVAMVPVEYTSPYEKVNVSFKAIANEETILDTVAEISKGTNAFEAMQEIAEVEFTDYGEMGVMIESINGTAPKTNKFWKLFVNGEEATAGISSIVIEEDTAIEWKIDSFDSYTG